MARNKGTFNFSANLEPKVQAPLDARTVVDTVAELTQAATWQDANNDVWLFDGLVVSVAQTGELYMLTAKDAYTSAASWKRIDAGETEGKSVITLGYIAKYMDSPVGTDVSEVFGDYTLAELFGGEGKSKIVRFTVPNDLDTVDIGYQPVLFAEEHDVLGLGYRVLIKSKGRREFVPDPYFYELFFSEEDGVKKLTKNTRLRLLTDDAWSEVSEKVLLEDFSTFWNLTTESTPTEVKSAMPDSLYEFFYNGFELTTHPNVWIDIYPNNSAGVGPVSVVNTDVMDIYSPKIISELIGDKLYVITLQTEDTVNYKIISKSIITVGQTVESVTAGDGIEVEGTATAPVVKVKVVENDLSPIQLEINDRSLRAVVKESIVRGDKVLKFNPAADGQITIGTELGLTYDSGTKKINLTGKSNAVIATIDATDFIKDGMVQSVELEGNNLVFTFNTDAGKDVVTVDLSKFIDVYTAGGGITISGKLIDVKVDAASEDYLTVSEEGIKLSGIDAAIEAAITEAFSWHDA